MKSKYLSILLIFVLLASIAFSSPLTLDQPEEEDEPIQARPRPDGISIPRIDGFIDKSSPDLYLGEWGDGAVEQTQFKSSSGEMLDGVQLYTKVVSNNLYIAFVYPKSIQEALVTVDINEDGKLSNNDALIRITHANDLRSYFSQQTQTQLFIYKDGVWVDNQDYDATNMPPDPLEYLQALSTIVGASSRNWDPGDISSPEWDPSETVEIYFNPVAFQSYFKIPSPHAGLSLDEVSTGEMGYAVAIKDVNNGVYGFPEVPKAVNDASKMYVGTSYAQYDYFYDIAKLKDFILNIGIERVEVTQSVQTINNDLSLVQGKQTLVRVFISGNTAPQEVQVDLYAYGIGFLELVEIGMLSKMFTAPVGADRLNLGDSANFILPESWISNPYLILKTIISPIDLVDPNTSNNEVTSIFPLKKTRDMNIYYIRVNSGTNAIPDQVTTSWVNLAKAGLIAMYPMANPNFIELGWETMGVFTGDSEALKAELNQIAANLVLTALIMEILGLEPLAIPDQVFGFTTTGAGSSSPAWADYPLNYGAWGGLGAAVGPLVMSHEINHNLGDNNWGRHVGDNIYNVDWGCGAKGPDAAWPQTIDDINAVYSSTIGWNPATGIVPSDKPDIMSYCRDLSSNLYRWVSDYRWEHWISRLQASSPVMNLLTNRLVSIQSTQLDSGLSIDFTLPQVRVISGYVYPKGNAEFLPSYTDAGIWNEEHTLSGKATHNLVVSYLNKTKVTIPMLIEFNDYYADGEHQIPDRKYFSHWIEDDGNITGFDLFDVAGNLLASRAISDFIVLGNFGVQSTITRGKGIVFDYGYSLSKNTSTVLSQLQYAHDGNHWINLGSQTSELTLPYIELISEPGGEKAQFRIRFTDGFKTIYLYASNTVSVPDLPPEIKILRNTNRFIPDAGDKAIVDNNVTLQSGSTLSLQSSAYDPETGLLPAVQILWSIYDPSGKLLATFNGDRLNYQFRFPGDYFLKVVATDPQGNEGSAEITVSIQSPSYLLEQRYTNFVATIKSMIDISTTSKNNDQTSKGINLSWSYSTVLISLLMLPLLIRKHQKS